MATSVPAPSERRSDPRFSLVRALEVHEREHGAFVGRVIDVGTGGLRLVGPGPIGIGRVLDVVMRLPDNGGPVELRLRTTWSDGPGGGADHHFGCELLGPSCEHIAAIEAPLRRLRRYLADQVP